MPYLFPAPCTIVEDKEDHHHDDDQEVDYDDGSAQVLVIDHERTP